MSLDMLDTNFSGLSSGDYILRMSIIADKLEAHPAFPEFPEHVPGPARLRELVEQFKKALDAAANGDRQKIAEKKAIRAEGEQAQTITAYHVTMISIHRKDPTVLLNTGWELRHRAAWGKGASNSIPEAPSKFIVKHGATPGTIAASVNRAHGTASIELQATEGDPSIDSSWTLLGMFLQCRMEVKNLEPAKRYHFRARFHAAGTKGPWSQIVNLIVI